MTQNNRTHHGVTTRPEPGSTDTVLVYREGVFLGRVCGHTVHDCTGRLRSDDDFCRFMLSAVPR